MKQEANDKMAEVIVGVLGGIGIGKSEFIKSMKKRRLGSRLPSMLVTPGELKVYEESKRVKDLAASVFYPALKRKDRYALFAAEIAMLSAEVARNFNVEPRVAMLSFSNFGSTKHPLAEKVRKATELLKQKAPGLVVDGEMQADTAVVPEIIEQDYPFSTLKGNANILIFPSLEAGNAAYKLMARIGGAEALGPILMGLSKPVHVLQRGATVEEIINMAAIAVVGAQQSAS